jgi:hypothetical protein
MDADTAVALAGEAAQLNVLYTLFALALLVAAAGAIFALGEKALGFNTKKFLNHVEAAAKAGNLWPGVVLLISVQCLFGLVLFIGLR